MSEKEREGWVNLWNARKDHYIVGFRSLCGRWGFLGGTDCLVADEGGPSRHDCVACRRALDKRQAAR